MPAAVAAEGYEAKGDKYYKLYDGTDEANHFEASKKCQSVGARLAMMKTQDDFDAVSYYKGNNIIYKLIYIVRYVKTGFVFILQQVKLHLPICGLGCSMTSLRNAMAKQHVKENLLGLMKLPPLQTLHLILKRYHF